MVAGDSHLRSRKLQQGSASEERQHGMLKTARKQQQQGRVSAAGSGILKAKKEASAAARLLRFKHIPGGMDMWMDEWREMKAQAAAEEEAARKRKRVVKHRLPRALIDHMVARPFRSVEDLTPAQLARRFRDFRRFYPLTTFVDAKMRDYEQALIRQYNALGYAEDETEVTDTEDDEEEEEAMLVEK